MKLKPEQVAELAFEEQDLEIFKIPDVKTKFETVQNYFFPRMEFLLKYTLDKVQEVYQTDPYERLTFVHKPDNRKKADTNFDFDEAFVGVAGRRTSHDLNIFHQNGEPFHIHPTYLTYNLTPKGYFRTELLLFRQNIDLQFVEAMASLLQQHMDLIAPILALAHISYSSAQEFIPMQEAFSTSRIRHERLYSSDFPVPLGSRRGLQNLVTSFLALYPFVEASVSLAYGESPQLAEMLVRFQEWWRTKPDEILEDGDLNLVSASNLESILTDSYAITRPGVWYRVLAKYNWTCKSCGRSTKEDGVKLQVDHIIPRSKGGTNDLENLQPLCQKCNIGKSNRDQTDLR